MACYQKNLESLREVNPVLAERLEYVDELRRFEPFSTTPENPKSVNIFDHRAGEMLYDDPEVDLGLKVTLDGGIRASSSLYCFGVGNGSLVHMLLQEHRVKRLVVMEPEDEVLYIALNLFDVSEALREERLVLLHTEQVSDERIDALLRHGNALAQRNRFALLRATGYYDRHYGEAIAWCEARFKNGFDTYLVKIGNNLADSLKGVRQTLQNIPVMIENHPLQSLIALKPSSKAIIVSTGPSLEKQLPLLKEAAAYATIISVDASLPILERYDIKPDFCVSMERDEPTAEFFKRTSDEFMRGIVFVCASVQHADVFEALRGQQLVVFLRRNAENHYFGLDDYGYLGYGFSAANFAHDFACELGVDEAVLIGQDLAFGNDGTTHATGHIFDSNPSIDKEIRERRLFEIEGYGGGHTVTTHVFWKLFLDAFVESVARYEGRMRTVNATEGGARIAGTKERPFADVVASLRDEGILKQPVVLTPVASDVQARRLRAYRKKLRELVAEGNRFTSGLERSLKLLETITEVTGNLIGAQKKGKFPLASLNHAIKVVTDLRNGIDKTPAVAKFFMPIIMPNIMKLEIACQDAMFADKEDKELYAIGFIEANRAFLAVLERDMGQLRQIIETVEKEQE